MASSQRVQLEVGQVDVIGRHTTRSSSRVAYEAFYRANRTRAIALAAALCGNRWAAEEMAHDAFVSAWQQWDKISGYDAPELWLRRAVLHRVISRSRRAASEARALGRLASRRAGKLPELSTEDELFWRHVRDLPRRQGQAVALFYLDDLSIEQIAVVLGVSDGAVKNALHSGRQRLRERLDEGQDHAVPMEEDHR